ncbi:MAG: cbb3-type cytochrome c oxidase subunit 3 [Niveispirillum sp.]|nr:cbb3-type cytochrome c oxidase subunit 3 [Niveispirillum sp.]
MTDEAILSLFRQGWLLLAVAAFLGIVWRAFRPSQAQTMRDHARIPFQIKDDDNGAA